MRDFARVSALFSLYLPCTPCLASCSTDTVIAEVGSSSSEATSSTASGDESSSDAGESGDDESLPPSCDPWAPSCGADQKCVPWADEHGEFLEDRCVPVLGERQPGQLCEWDGVGIGTDDCDTRSFCWHHDASGDGICRELCMGTRAEWSCATESSTCSLTGSVDNLCLPSCYPLIEPLIDPCLPGDACYFVPQASWFVCLPGGELGFGEACEQPNDCADGLTCVSGEALPDCLAERCCTSYCVSGLGSDPCASLGPGWWCERFFPVPAPGIGSPDSTVGICRGPWP